MFWRDRKGAFGGHGSEDVLGGAMDMVNVGIDNHVTAGLFPQAWPIAFKAGEGLAGEPLRRGGDGDLRRLVGRVAVGEDDAQGDWWEVGD